MKTQSKEPFLSLVLCGIGVAGRAREKAAKTIDTLQLAGTISRRTGLGTLSWKEALANEAIQAIAISTENADHPSRVHDALQAGKHVLCDYPLAADVKTARELFALAHSKNLVLHVEHIGLLSEDHQSFKRELEKAGRLKEGRFVFQAGWNEKLADVSYSGPFNFLVISRLMQLADVFGEFSISRSKLEVDLQHFLLDLHLNFKQGGAIHFTEERRPSLTRGRQCEVQCEKQTLSWKTGTMTGGLFAQDLAWFADRVLHQRSCYYDEDLMLRVYQELETVNSQK